MAKGLDAIREGRGEVLLFSGIGGEVEEGDVFEVAAPGSPPVMAVGHDELEVAVTNPAVGDVPLRLAEAGGITGVDFAKDRVVCERGGSSGGGPEGAAGEAGDGVREAQGVQDGGEEIDAADGWRMGGGDDGSGEAEEDGGAQAVLEGGGFAFAGVSELEGIFLQLPVAGCPAIVGTENDEGGGEEVAFLQDPQEAADGVIELADGGEVRDAMGGSAALAVKIVVVAWGIVRLVGKIGRVPEEEGTGAGGAVE